MRKIEESRKMRVKVGMLLYDDVRTCLTDVTFKQRPGGGESVLVAQSCLTLCHPMDCSLPGSSVHGILQARILKWVAVPFFKGSS